MHVKFDWDLRLINWEIYANNSYKVVGNNFGNYVEVNLDLFEEDKCDCPFLSLFCQQFK